MIIIRKDQLKIIDPTSEPMRSRMPVFDFAEHSAEDIDMMVKVLTRKMIDLGAWASESYRIESPLTPELPEDAEE